MSNNGLIYTFYSYKGGVGRSMALANISMLLAQRNKKVLMIDWDLEAPGLEKYFENIYPEIIPDRSRKYGVVDLMTSAGTTDEIAWQDCIIQIKSKNVSNNLFLISAGRLSDNYLKKVQNTNWETLFRENKLGSYLEILRHEWKKEFDFILIDSRTGVTDIGGICTIHLPDILVLLFTTNYSSYNGILDIVKRIRESHQKLPYDRNKLITIPLPSRDESNTELESALRWRKIFAEGLTELFSDWLPKDQKTINALEFLKIPYIPYWSFGERLPVIEEGISNPSGIGFYYNIMANLIQNNLDWRKTLAGDIEMNININEEEYNMSKMNLVSEEYINERVNEQIEFYSRKSRFNQTSYRTLTLFQILAGLSIPIISQFILSDSFNKGIIISVLGLSIALISGMLSMYKFQENWLEYRKTAEELKKEKFLFLTKTEPYDYGDPFNLFVKRIESLMSSERVRWQDTNKTNESYSSIIKK